MIELVQRFGLNKDEINPIANGLPFTEAMQLAPIDQPRRNIFCVGKNNCEYAAESQELGFDHHAKEEKHAPEAPIVFTNPEPTETSPELQSRATHK